MAFSQSDLFEIFSWLPAKAIYQCQSVCKSLFKVSKERVFQIKQSQNMLIKNDTCFFIQLDTHHKYNEHIELHPLLEEQLSSGVPSDILELLSYSTRVLDSSNGLILCRTTYNNPIELFIYNPVTQSRLPIPTPECLQRNPDANLNIRLECYRENLDSDEFKIILFEDPIDWESTYSVCHVFHPKDGVWKTLEKLFYIGREKVKLNMPVKYNGCLHFISKCFPSYDKSSPYIMSYSLENGVSRMISVPEEARRDCRELDGEMSIFNWSNLSSLVPQSICLVRLRKSVFTIWVLKDYESSLWYKILEVKLLEAMRLKKDPKVSGFTVMNGDVLLFSIDKKVYSYGLIGEKFMRLEEVCEHRCDSMVTFIPYSNTLRSCGIGATTLPISHPGEENV